MRGRLGWIGLASLLSAGVGCGQESYVDSKLNLIISTGCSPSWADLKAQTGLYCLMLLDNKHQELRKNCVASMDSGLPLVIPSSGKNSLALKLYASDKKTVIATGESYAVDFSHFQTVPATSQTITIPVTPTTAFGQRTFSLIAGGTKCRTALPFSMEGSTATALPSGHVLVVGTRKALGAGTKPAFLWDPYGRTAQTVDNAPLELYRFGHSAVPVDLGIAGPSIVFLGGVHTPKLAGSTDVVLLRGAKDFLGADYASLGPNLLSFEVLTGKLSFAPVIHNAVALYGSRVLVHDGTNPPIEFDADTRQVKALNDPGSLLISLTGPARLIPFSNAVVESKAFALGGKVKRAGAITLSQTKPDLTFSSYSVEPSLVDFGYPEGVLLDSRRALFLGGTDTANRLVILNADPGKATEIAIPTTFVLPTIGFTLTRLPSGTVLLAGGSNAANSGFLPGKTFYINFASATISEGPNLQMPRAGHEAVLLADSRVLLFGGRSSTPTTITDDEVGSSAEEISFATE